MRINGHDARRVNLQEAFGAVCESENDTELENSDEELKARLAESNASGNIPRRFEQCRFSSESGACEKVLKPFCVAKESDKCVLLTGPTGTGKTTAACSAMHERAAMGMNAGLYLSMRLLAPMLRTSRSFSARESEMAILEKYSRAPFLVLDEIGACDNPSEERSFLRTVIAARYDNFLPSILSTNLTTDKLKLFLVGREPYGFSSDAELRQFISEVADKDPIVNRLKSIMRVVVMDGESRRQRL